MAAFVLSAVIFCPDFLSCPAIFIASFYFHLHHMNMSILNLNGFFQDFFFIISDGPSLNHRWSGKGAMGSSWPSMICTGVLVRARSGPDSKPHRFHNNCEEMLLWKLRNLLSKNFLINHEVLIPHGVRKLNFFMDPLFFWHNSVNGVQLGR